MVRLSAVRGIIFPQIRRPSVWPTSPPITVNSFFGGSGDRAVKLTNCLHLVSRLKMSGSIPTLPHMLSCRSQ
jgi:hypothetical protein